MAVKSTATPYADKHRPNPYTDMKTFQPRFENGIYRDCKWCHGKGCVYCPAEADAEYKRQFPDGPKPIASFSTKDIEGGALGLFKSVFSPEGIMAAKEESRKRAKDVIEKYPETRCFDGAVKAKAIEAMSQDYVGEVIQENIIKLAKKSPKARKYINQDLL
jgi:hypothetical protein